MYKWIADLQNKTGNQQDMERFISKEILTYLL